MRFSNKLFRMKYVGKHRWKSAVSSYFQEGAVVDPLRIRMLV